MASCKKCKEVFNVLDMEMIDGKCKNCIEEEKHTKSIEEEYEKSLTIGKIIVYDNTVGNGIIITKDNEKVKFNVESWTDFNNLPQVGQNIAINDDNKVFLYRSKQEIAEESVNEELINYKNKSSEYIDNMISKGWKKTHETDKGFVIEKPGSFQVVNFLIISILLAILVGAFLGFIGVLIALIVAVVASLPKTKRYEGRFNFEEKKIDIKEHYYIVKSIKI